MTNYNYFDNTGGLNLFSSVATLDESEKSTEWYDAKNVESHKSGAIIKMKGAHNVCSTVLGTDVKILGIYDYQKSNNHQLIVNTSEGKLYRLDSSGVLSELYSGLDTSCKCNYINFNNGVIIANGKDIPLFYEEGMTEAEELGDDAPTGLALEVYKARLFIAKDSCLYYSALGNPYDWTSSDAGFIENFHNDSSPIMAIKNYGEYLAIYKTNSAYVLSGSSPAEFAIQSIADKGATSSFSIVTVENKQYFFNGENITPLRFNELGQILLADDVSLKIKPAFDDFDTTRYEEVICLPYIKKNQIWFYFPEKNEEDLTVCYIYDYYHKAWYKRVGIPIVSACLMDGYIYTGTSDGRILKEDIGDNFDGEAIEAYWYSPYFSFSQPHVEKEMLSCNVWVFQDLAHPLNIKYSTDYAFSNSTSNYISVSSSVDLIWCLSSDSESTLWDDFYWSNDNPVMKNININGTFNSFQIGVENLEANQPFTLIGYGFEVDFA